ncbi:MAG: inositol monophosphatase [Proteobacteria bacterium]|nr:inositol monophosphatase [Pseudomonadota bacterium]
MKHAEYWLAGAVEAALQAGKVIRTHYTKPLRIREKGGLGLVTNADVQAEITALKVLRKCEPSFAFLSEETHAQGVRTGDQEGLWIVDPLDGTTNFIHRFPMFCVNIALQFRDEVEVAVTYHPILDELYTAVRGKGAFLSGKRMKVSKTRTVRNALLSTGFAYSARDSLSTEMTSFERVSRAARAVRRPGSAALDLAYTARGVFDGFWERNLAPWDMAAGMLLVREAGGRVTNFKNMKFDGFQPEILATNGALHGAIRKLI